MGRFREYANRRLLENMDISSLRAMILHALGANDDSEDAYNSPLTQFAKPADLLDRLYSLNSLKQLIDQNPAAVQAIQSAQQNKLSVGELAGILLPSANA